MRRIAITIGDPAGIGPEIVARALERRPELVPRVTVFGDRQVLSRAGLTTDVQIEAVTHLGPDEVVPGQPSVRSGAAQVAYLEAAVAAARRPDPENEIAALVTAPISKTWAKAAGFAFPGHTEFLADAFQAPGHEIEHAMMFVGPRLRVVLATIHIALGEVPRALTVDAVARSIFLGGEALTRRFAVSRPRIVVLGLNPHAGEGGLFGREEIEIVSPGIAAGRERLAAAGITADLIGPLPPDTAFRAEADLFVALYHDQGLIPVKLLDFEQAVNVTLGLPIVRTSPDHGVAYDIAGRNQARAESFIAALDLAKRMIDA